MRWVAAILCLAWFGASPAHAQSDKKKALEHYEQAEAYMKAKAYAKAVEEYESAYALVPKAGFLFNIGLAYEAANDAVKAVEYFDKYVNLDPKGRKATEARARAEALRPKAEAKLAAADHARKVSDAAAAAEQALSAGDHDTAIAKFGVAFDLSKDPEHVFGIAEAYRGKGDSDRAVAEYQRYRQLAPAGSHSAAALEHITTIERAAKADAVPDEPIRKDIVTQPPDEPVVGATKNKDDGGISWGWLAAGAAVVAGGVLADVIPESGENGEWDATDFVPVGLYAAGGFFVYKGVF